jgi:RimJ/RimL family protein N-acetyltransferase
MEHNAEPIGMVSLTVDVANYKAEFGRLFIDNLHRRLGYGEVATYIVLYYAFEVLRLNYVWADVKINNISAVAFYEKVGFIKQEDKESVHENAVIYEYYRMQWQQVGRVQFGELLKMELPQWEA